MKFSRAKVKVSLENMNMIMGKLVKESEQPNLKRQRQVENIIL